MATRRSAQLNRAPFRHGRAALAASRSMVARHSCHCALPQKRAQGVGDASVGPERDVSAFGASYRYHHAGPARIAAVEQQDQRAAQGDALPRHAQQPVARGQRARTYGNRNRLYDRADESEAVEEQAQVAANRCGQPAQLGRAKDRAEPVVVAAVFDWQLWKAQGTVAVGQSDCVHGATHWTDAARGAQARRQSDR